MSRRRRLPPALKDLRLRGRLRLRPAPDPKRRKRELPPTASLEDYIEDLIGWMTAGGFSAEDAQRQGEWVRDFHRKTGINFPALPVEDQAAFVLEFDRLIEQLAQEEAEELADVDPDEPEH